MLRYVLDSVARLKLARVVGVLAPGAELVATTFAPQPTAVQHETLGAGDATKAALAVLGLRPPRVRTVHAAAGLQVVDEFPLTPNRKIDLVKLKQECAAQASHWMAGGSEKTAS
jgi:bifunctional N-acetylglucosamine-1-phosphate-uridyltransferase/glucosamine-1-phosphate-acetyltransferase GlmU-like protein